MVEKTLFPPSSVLVVDDELSALNSVSVALKTAGINNIRTCSDSREVLGVLRNEMPELVILDLSMPHISGEELLNEVVRDFPGLPVIVATGTDDLTTAVSCMRIGAFDYLVKPVGKERLVTSVRRAIEMRCLRRENDQLKRHVLSGELFKPEIFDEFDTISTSMRSLFQYVESIAESPSTVLITGETGVGKELMARAVHKASGRSGQFVPVNVAGLDANSFSDTLFGHRKGAFTGAIENRAGVIEKAAGGSLFLDEIGDLTQELQVKLLRLLQEREYLQLGSDVPKRSDARVIVATNRSLEELRDTSRFRSDLYYRLCHHHIHIPPLRERRDDLAMLLPRMVEKSAALLRKDPPGVSPVIAKFLTGYDFPGNVRELDAMVMEAVSLCRGDELTADGFRSWIAKHAPDEAALMTLPDSAPTVAFGADLPTLKSIQDLLIEEALDRTDGNHSQAAQLLGITRQGLGQRLQRRNKVQDD